MPTLELSDEEARALIRHLGAPRNVFDPTDHLSVLHWRLGQLVLGLDNALGAVIVDVASALSLSVEPRVAAGGYYLSHSDGRAAEVVLSAGKFYIRANLVKGGEVMLPVPTNKDGLISAISHWMSFLEATR